MICAYVDLRVTIYAQVLGSFAGSLFVPLDIRGTLPVARISPKQFHFFHPFLGVLEMYSVWNLSYFLMGICTSIKKNLISIQAKTHCFDVGGIGLHNFTSITSLKYLNLCRKSEEVESFPEEGLLPSTLTSL